MCGGQFYLGSDNPPHDLPHDIQRARDVEAASFHAVPAALAISAKGQPAPRADGHAAVPAAKWGFVISRPSRPVSQSGGKEGLTKSWGRTTAGRCCNYKSFRGATEDDAAGAPLRTQKLGSGVPAFT